MGYDLHRVAEGRKLVLGGVEVPHDRGLAGHSDADVLLHAIADAMLGAAGLPDIGRCFPDDDPQYEGIASSDLVDRVLELIRSKGLVPHHVDAVVIAEKPRLAEHIDRIVANIARLLALPRDMVGLKAKTNEGLGPLGSGEAIAAYAVVVLKEQSG
ncbi:MAG TPA: 2-C-methyl-D-erythritol 2,4-cyclodiphosphate synthase [Proteobacteria bacterium]|nr:2-C-methyl-D-erythritol 2,4-cyclodiphosphate synthase [Pseudomonadota bacterium]